MYQKFFKLKEKPFKLVPDPSYLLLGKNQEEVMAHLNYALREGDGFVEFTGEVGTGKTTLCRAFLEKAEEDPNIETAYIFNPRLNEVQLLQTLNDEFGIDSTKDNIKELIDVLNDFLIRQKSEDKKVILIIDEAQNLSPEVLELLRLLSNLETTTSKLLQIVLVGQPELSEMLNSYQLRQLGQRITLSVRLYPFSLEETCDYINHRILLASERVTARFTHSAFRAIYKQSKGNPRLINILCDKALLVAFVNESQIINSGVVKKEIQEQKSRFKNKRTVFLKSVLILLFILIITAAVFGYFFYFKEKKITKDTPIQKTPIIEDTKEKKPENKNLDNNKTIAEETQTIQTQNLAEILRSRQWLSSRNQAVETLFSAWKQEKILQTPQNIDIDIDFFRIVSKQNGFSLYILKQGTIEEIKKINLPVILKFLVPDKNYYVYLTVSAITDEHIVFAQGNNTKAMVSIQEFQTYKPQTGFVFWKNFYLIENIPSPLAKDSVMPLKLLLKDAGFTGIPFDAKYDEITMQSIKFFQEINGIESTGTVEDLTKILLYNYNQNLGIPFLL